jgi:ABC-type glycerol-3-phosphate transport system permease component
MSASTRTSATQLLDNERFWRIFVWTVLLVGALVMFLPFLWLLSSSLKTELAIFRYPPEWIPDPPQFSNYVDAWTTRPFAVYVRNTLVILLLNEVAVLVSASFCAYGFARIDFPGRNVWFAILLATVMLPGIVTMIPQFVIFSRIGWVNTILPLTVPFFFGGGAFNIFLLRQFFRTLPAELADAAYIDGASEITIYWRIMLPLAKPALATIAIFTFMSQWNSFLEPLIFLNSSKKYTLALGLAMFRDQFDVDWNAIMAMSFLMVLPCLTIFFLAQKYFIQGISTTGLKG